MRKRVRTLIAIAAMQAAGIAIAEAQTNSPVARETVSIDDAFVKRYFKYITFGTDTVLLEKQYEQLCPIKSWSFSSCIKKAQYLLDLTSGWNAKTNSYEEPFAKVTAEVAEAKAEIAKLAASSVDEMTKDMLESWEWMLKTAQAQLAKFPAPIPAAHLALMKKNSTLIKAFREKRS